MQLRYTNRLLTATSPYLQLHAHDPVDWFPWGPEAFERARREDKPIFLSVGYSTCHWCHVMQDESFSNAAIAEYMNRHFISVKVDREEYPDVDRLYMGYATSVSDGGWPMSLFLTPDLEPFAGANYLPPDDRGNEPGFRTVLRRVHTLWDTNRPAALRAAENGTTTIELHARGAGSGPPVAPGIFDDTFRGITASYDADGGGFSGAPKFPRPVVMTFLFRYYARTGDAPALDMTLDTLRAMARGGVHDQLGGGFHRYATDRLWRIPHFEKMLYDQAQLAVAYAEAYQVTKDPDFGEVARGILDYVLRDMRDAGGAFYSAEDADSAAAPEASPSEGAFYVWSDGDVRRVLGKADADVFAYHYGIEEGGNVPAALDAQGELRGQNVLSVRHSTAETAARFRRTESAVLRSLGASREKLRSARAARPRPPRDDKILVAWNGLMISALARTSQIVDDTRYLDAARAAAAFIETRLYDEPTGSLTRRYRQGRADIDALLEDYAFLIQGLLDLHEASFETRWLTWAIRLQETQDHLFWDTKGGGYYSTRADAPHVIARVKEDYDGAEPAANSVATMNLLRLWQITGAQTWLDHADGTVAGLSERLARSGAAMPQLVAALDFRRSTPKQIVIAGTPGAADTRAMLRLVHDRFIPNKILMLADGGPEQTQMASLAPYVRDMAPRNGRATIYVCEHYVCRLPTSDPAAAARLLDAR